MISEYIIRVRLPNSVITEVAIRAVSYSAAASQASAFGEVLGLLESRYI
jgi:hypothetical protein